MTLSIRILAPLLALAAFALAEIVWLAMRMMEREPGESLVQTLVPVVTALVLAAGGAVWLMIREVRSIARRAEVLADEVRTLIETDVERLPTARGGADIFAVARLRLRELALQTRAALENRAEIERQANTDELTNLRNRRGLMVFLETALDQAGDAPHTGGVGVMHIDLDHFKTVNDTLGHEAGDFVLKEASRRLQGVLRDSDVLARLGGDEFVAVVPGVEETEVLERLAGRMLAQLRHPIRYQSHDCLIGASVGAVLASPENLSANPQSLLTQADLALCQAKAGGRDRAAVFSDEIAAQLSEAEEQAREIKEALLEDAFEPWFQPMVNVRTGNVTGIELLSRWHHPKRGLIQPKDFLMAAESHGMLEEIGLQVLGKACGAIQRWRSDGVNVPKLYVNMTRSQLLAPAAVDKITWILDDHNVSPDQIALEISERALVERSVDLLFANLRRLSLLGVEKVLDDFGSTDASIRNVVAIGASKIKCSRVLVNGLADQAEARDAGALLAAALGVADRLGVTTVAKGVEGAPVIETLSSIGFAEMQGDALAPAMPTSALLHWLTERPATAASA